MTRTSFITGPGGNRDVSVVGRNGGEEVLSKRSGDGEAAESAAVVAVG